MADKVDVGDAVLTFMGDMTQLDLAFDKVNAMVPNALNPAKEATTDLSDTLQGLGTYFGQAGEAGIEAGEEIEGGMKKASAAAREARGEMALLGEETGVRIPRHLRSFVAELPGVGEALTAAFSATAVLMLLQILVEGTEKLTNWISATFIFTQAMKDADASVKVANAALLDYAAKTVAAKQATESFGKTPLELATANLKKLTDELDKQKKSFQDNLQTQAAYRMGLDGITEAASRKAGEANDLLDKAMKLQNDLIEKQQVEQAQLIVTTTEKTARETIAVENSIAESKRKIWEAFALYQASTAKNAAVATLEVERESAEKEYQLKLDTLKRERAAQIKAESDFKSIGDDKGAQAQLQEIRATNAKIEALNAEHYAKETKAYIDFQNTFKEISTQIMSLSRRSVPDLGPVITDMQLLEEAADKLGVTLSGTLEEAFTSAEKALTVMQKAYGQGTITTKQYDQALLADVQAQIAWQKSLGNSTTALEKQEKVLQDEINGVQKTNKVWDSFASEFAKKSKNVGDEATAMGSMLGKAGAQMDEAFASAMMGALASGQSIGQALEKATATVLENLATQALAHAMYCVAMGTAELALGVTSSSAAEWFTAAAEFGLVAGAAGAAGMAMSGSGGNGGGGRNNVTSASNPTGASQSSSAGGSVSVTGVQKFAAGGLITGPTLAMIGEDSSKPTEAILPLDDDNAMSKIRDGLGSGGDTHLHVNARGVLDSGSLIRTMDKYQRMIKKNRASFTASNSLRLTRRSQ